MQTYTHIHTYKYVFFHATAVAAAAVCVYCVDCDPVLVRIFFARVLFTIEHLLQLDDADTKCVMQSMTYRMNWWSLNIHRHEYSFFVFFFIFCCLVVVSTPSSFFRFNLKRKKPKDDFSVALQFVVIKFVSEINQRKANNY